MGCDCGRDTCTPSRTQHLSKRGRYEGLSRAADLPEGRFMYHTLAIQCRLLARGGVLLLSKAEYRDKGRIKR